MRRALSLRAQAPRPRPARVHPIACHCEHCDPHRTSEAMRALNHWARLTLIGLGLGLGAAWLLDLAIGGPGVLSIFGV
ncbi:hypothetical protein M2341_002006 [Sphingobium sp. B7D2B]|uniref:hypothetical protein n=1 Tax=Sphingobium sp. B7D2B TaxID=2940583 RepID=UPI002225A58D|nr:hypothetical protein [Sphingobium sp. B7D2B]MCW2366559.1 hypothetical protein [Sphingobium sp. B7D2B]